MVDDLVQVRWRICALELDKEFRNHRHIERDGDGFGHAGAERPPARIGGGAKRAQW